MWALATRCGTRTAPGGPAAAAVLVVLVCVCLCVARVVHQKPGTAQRTEHPRFCGGRARRDGLGGTGPGMVERRGPLVGDGAAAAIEHDTIGWWV